MAVLPYMALVKLLKNILWRKYLADFQKQM